MSVIASYDQRKKPFFSTCILICAISLLSGCFKAEKKNSWSETYQAVQTYKIPDNDYTRNARAGLQEFLMKRCSDRTGHMCSDPPPPFVIKITAPCSPGVLTSDKRFCKPSGPLDWKYDQTFDDWKFATGVLMPELARKAEKDGDIRGAAKYLKYADLALTMISGIPGTSFDRSNVRSKSDESRALRDIREERGRVQRRIDELDRADELAKQEAELIAHNIDKTEGFITVSDSIDDALNDIGSVDCGLSENFELEACRY